MNVAEYGQNLRKIADRNLQDLATLDRERLNARTSLNRLEEESTMAGLGALAGAGLGAAKGAYQSYKAGERRASGNDNLSPSVRAIMQEMGYDDSQGTWAWDMAQQFSPFLDLFRSKS